MAVWVGIGLLWATTALGIWQDQPQMIWEGEVDGVSIGTPGAGNCGGCSNRTGRSRRCGRRRKSPSCTRTCITGVGRDVFRIS